MHALYVIYIYNSSTVVYNDSNGKSPEVIERGDKKKKYRAFFNRNEYRH